MKEFSMPILNAQSRDPLAKVNQLRRSGFIPGVLYGKNLKKSLSIQFSKADIVRFLRSNSVGSKAELAIDGKKHTVLLREVFYKASTNELKHLSFQALLAGEIVTSTVRVTLLNRDKITDMIQQPQDEISYRALPSHLIDKIEIDLDGMTAGDSIRISDLDISKDPDIEILNPPDTMIVSIVEARRAVKETESEEEAPEAESE